IPTPFLDGSQPAGQTIVMRRIARIGVLTHRFRSSAEVGVLGSNFALDGPPSGRTGGSGRSCRVTRYGISGAPGPCVQVPCGTARRMPQGSLPRGSSRIVVSSGETVTFHFRAGWPPQTLVSSGLLMIVLAMTTLPLARYWASRRLLGP